MKKILLLLSLAVLNYGIKAQINVNGNIYIGDGDSVYIAKGTSVGFDTLYIGQPNSTQIQTAYVQCDENVGLYARGGVNVYGEPNKIIMHTGSSLNLYNTTGNNKTFVVNVDPSISFIQNLNFIDTLDNISNVYLASKENQIRVINQFNFSNKWQQTVTLKPLNGNPLDLYVESGTMNGLRKSYIVTLDQTTTLSQPVPVTGETFFVGSGINQDSFFSPVRIIPSAGTGVVQVASLSHKPQYGLLQGGEREEYVNNFWYINAPTITKATVGLQHHPDLEIAPFQVNQTLYYYPEDTATILRYVGSFPNKAGSDSSFSNWEAISWADKESNTQIANSNNNSNMMIWNEERSKYMQRKEIENFNSYPYFAKVRYADDKAPLTGNDNLGRDLSTNTGHLLVPDYLEVTPSITGGNQITLTFKVKNEYRIYGYEIYRNDINDPNFEESGAASMILAGTIDAKAKTNFDSGRYVHTYKFVDDGISSVNNSSTFYYQIRPIGGTGRGVRASEVTQAGSSNTKKLTILGNPVSRVQGVIRYRFTSIEIEYASLRVALVNSAGNVIGVENVAPNQTKFYESNAYFSTNNLPAGVYLLVAQATRPDGKVEVFTSRIIVE